MTAASEAGACRIVPKCSTLKFSMIFTVAVKQLTALFVAGAGSHINTAIKLTQCPAVLPGAVPMPGCQGCSSGMLPASVATG